MSFDKRPTRPLQSKQSTARGYAAPARTCPNLGPRRPLLTASGSSPAACARARCEARMDSDDNDGGRAGRGMAFTETTGASVAVAMGGGCTASHTCDRPHATPLHRATIPASHLSRYPSLSRLPPTPLPPSQTRSEARGAKTASSTRGRGWAAAGGVARCVVWQRGDGGGVGKRCVNRACMPPLHSSARHTHNIPHLACSPAPVTGSVPR